jgi:hypothetical protein
MGVLNGAKKLSDLCFDLFLDLANAPIEFHNKKVMKQKKISPEIE